MISYNFPRFPMIFPWFSQNFPQFTQKHWSPWPPTGHHSPSPFGPMAWRQMGASCSEAEIGTAEEYRNYSVDIWINKHIYAYIYIILYTRNCIYVYCIIYIDIYNHILYRYYLNILIVYYIMFMLCYILYVLYYIILYYTILYYIILHYIIFYYIILYIYAIPFWSGPFPIGNWVLECPEIIIVICCGMLWWYGTGIEMG
jgi:hypothetical protein